MLIQSINVRCYINIRSSMLDKVASKPVDKDKEGDQKNKNNEDTK